MVNSMSFKIPVIQRLDHETAHSELFSVILVSGWTIDDFWRFSTIEFSDIVGMFMFVEGGEEGSFVFKIPAGIESEDGGIVFE